MDGGVGLVFTAAFSGGAGRVTSCGQSRWPDDTQVLFARLVNEILILRICAEAAVGAGNVDQARAGIERHGRPVMPAAGSGCQHDGLAAIVRFFIHDRPPSSLIQSFGPVHLHPGLARDELSRHAIEHVIEAVFVGLHDHFALPPFDGEIGQHQLLHAVVVPGIAGNHLEIPFQFAGIGLHRENGAGIEIILALGFTNLFGPRPRVAGADVEQIRLGIIGHSIPNRCRRRPSSTLRATRSRTPFSSRHSRKAWWDRRARYKTSMRNGR